MPSATWSGSPSCFLFSITFDLKLPYHARELLNDRDNNGSSNNHQHHHPHPQHFFIHTHTSTYAH